MNFEVIICKQKTQNEPREEEAAAVEEKPAIIFRLVLMRKRVKKNIQNKRERNVNNAYHSDERQLSNITPQLEPQHKRV